MKKLQELRSAANLTQKELAEKIGVKNYTIANWEQQRTEPSIKDLMDLANFFECSVDYLLGREDDFGQIIIAEKYDKEQAEIYGMYSCLSTERKLLVRSLLENLKVLTVSEQQKNK